MDALINAVIWLVTTPVIGAAMAWAGGVLAGVNSADMDRAVAGAMVAVISGGLAVIVWSVVFWGVLV